ncbi:MAG TPA: ThuA domain-containing protein, partial [Streptomyces sp.]
MKRRWFGRRAAVVLAIGAVMAAGAPLIVMPVAQAAPAAVNVPVNVLVFHGAAGDQKDPVLRAADAIARLGQDNGITVTASSDPAVFSTANLARYRGVVFLSAQGVTLAREQEAALQAYMKAGGGFLGISDAARAQDSSQWFTGLIGARPVGARPTPEAVASVTASADNPPNETKEKLADNNENTKWLTFATTGWAAYKMATPVAVSSYSLVSANDFPGRDPKSWTLQGSADGSTWVDLDTRTNEVFQERFQTRTFTFANTTVYPNYRLNITANAGEPIIQLADLKLFKDTSTTPPPPEPAPQQAVVDVLDAQHPATAGLPQNWTRTDRWLNWETNP